MSQARTSIAVMRTWDVPSVDPGSQCWVGWSEKFGGYYLGTRTLEGEMFCYPRDADDPAFISVPALMVATMPAVDWHKVSPALIAELQTAPALAYLAEEHRTTREQAVASALQLALGA